MIGLRKIGLIAGQGSLPMLWTKAAQQKGYRVYAFPLLEQVDHSLTGIADQVSGVNIGALNDLINTLHQYDIKQLVMIGKVEKSLLFKGLVLDSRLEGLLAGLKQLNDDSILLGIVSELAKEGIEVLPQSFLIEELFPRKGVLTSRPPDQKLLTDLNYAFKIAREIGRLDIGQTVVVKNRTILAVEAIEGTDQAIIRGGELGGPGIVVAKVSKPQQDFRFDIPTIGETTIEKLIAVNASGLVIEAGKTFLLAREQVTSLAEENGIVIMARDFAETE
ncbi:MAG: UDP-2,3-diacylglucosamine diphosphatase LpxI [Halanaerobiales bacterium]|nr:UDP-2,3-diacylglucosamine diphosphatase LpxI [Halanaerobiales bacterium]